MTRRITSAIPNHPSEIACIDFVNTAYADPLNPGVELDRLSRREWWAWFLERYGLHVSARQVVPLRRLTTLRREMRAMLERWSTSGSLSARDLARLNRRLGKSRLRRRVRRRPALELTIEPVTPDWDWIVGAIATSAVELMAADHGRLKVCANPTCSWMFYDQTLNSSKQFCSTDMCGNIVRVRRFRSRADAK